MLLLLVATAISAGLWVIERDAALPYEAIAILAVVLLNASMGYVQEARAEAAVAALRAMSAAHATVVRGGARTPGGGRPRPRRHRPHRRRATGFPPTRGCSNRAAADRRSGADRREPACHQGHGSHRCRSAARRPPQHGLQRHGRDLRAWQGGRDRHRDADRDGPHRRAAEGRRPTKRRRCSRSSIAPASCSGIVVVVIAVVMIATIILVEDVRGVVCDLRRADSGRGAGRGGGAGRAAGRGDGRAGDRRAAHGAAQRDRPAPGRRRDARLGERDRLGQDRDADEERDDGARGRDGERPRARSRARATRRRATVQREGGGAIDGAAAYRARAGAHGRRPRQQRRRCRSATGAGRCRAIRPRARCSSRRARRARRATRSRHGCRASARCRSRPSAS